LNKLLVSSQQSLVISDRDSREQSQNCSAIGYISIEPRALPFPSHRDSAQYQNLRDKISINFNYNEFQIFREI